MEAPGRKVPGAGREVNVWRDETGRAVLRAYRDDRGAWIDYEHLGRFYFSTGSSVVEVQRVAGVSPAVLEETFARVLQPLILQAQGFEVLHASGSIVSGAVVAFVGHRHSGKSTMAFAMSKQGYTAFADDVVMLGFGSGTPLAHPLPFEPRLRPPARAFFDEPSRRHVLEPLPHTDQVSPRPLGAVILLRQDNHATESPLPIRLEPGEAFKRVLGYAQCFDGDSLDERRRVVEHYLALATSTPVFSLTYRPAFAHLAHLTRTVVEAIRQARPIDAPPAKPPLTARRS